jgi:hypothetical protein
MQEVSHELAVLSTLPRYSLLTIVSLLTSPLLVYDNTKDALLGRLAD